MMCDGGGAAAFGRFVGGWGELEIAAIIMLGFELTLVNFLLHGWISFSYCAALSFSLRNHQPSANFYMSNFIRLDEV